MQIWSALATSDGTGGQTIERPPPPTEVGELT